MISRYKGLSILSLALILLGGITGGTGVEVNFRYIKWNITERRSGVDLGAGCILGACVQASIFRLRHQNHEISLHSFENPGGSNHAGEGPSNLASYASTKWVDENFGTLGSANGESIIIAEAGDGPTHKFDSYEWYTANDFAGRDPKSWTLHGSDDEETWVLLDSIRGFVSPTARYTRAGTFPLTTGRPTPSRTPTGTSASNSASSSRTRTSTNSVSPSSSSSVTPSYTSSRSANPSGSATSSPSNTGNPTPTRTRSSTATGSTTPGKTSTPTNSASATTRIPCSPTTIMPESKTEICLLNKLSLHSSAGTIEQWNFDHWDGLSLEKQREFLVFQGKFPTTDEDSIQWKLSMFDKLYYHLKKRSGYALFATSNKVCVVGGLEASRNNERYHYEYTNDVCCAEVQKTAWCTNFSESTVPPPRGFSSWWSTEQGHYLFGGQAPFNANGDYGLLNDLWEYDIEKSKWSRLTDGSLSVSSPSTRRDSITWEAEGVHLLYGGYGAYPGEMEPQHLADLWRLKIIPVCKGGGHKWMKLLQHSLSDKFPSPRRLGGATVMNSIALMFGGEGKGDGRKVGRQYLSDLWALEYCNKEQIWVWKELPLSAATSGGFGGRVSCLLTAHNVNMNPKVVITGGYGYRHCYSSVAEWQADTLSVLLSFNDTSNY
eukprot:gb/GECG01015978.1/.p1 GENE.gb/GECG01015978.1/~~gb/GECG01015978.1/.p1  ORF type:complete len:660 (+),score=63.80 gb/GECG01015978.1/:1-1980(+)